MRCTRGCVSSGFCSVCPFRDFRCVGWRTVVKGYTPNSTQPFSSSFLHSATRVSCRTSVISAYIITSPMCGCCILSLQNPVFLQCISREKGRPPLRSQGSPLRSDPFLRRVRRGCGRDTPLTSFTPLGIKQVSGLSPKALSFYFLLLHTSHPEA